jgi:hypothetical protein
VYWLVLYHNQFFSAENPWLTVCYVNVKIVSYKNVTLPVDLYGCVSWSLTSKEERRMRLFENAVRGKILGQRGMK